MTFEKSKYLAITLFTVWVLTACSTTSTVMEPLHTGDLKLSQAKFGLKAVNDGELIYVLGGSGQSFSGDIEIINPDTNEVTLLRDKILPRRYFSAVFDGKESIYIIGGVGKKGKRLGLMTKVEVFNTKTHEVTLAKTFETPTRTNTAVFHDDKIYVLGGDVMKRSGLNSIPHMFVFDIKENNWSKLGYMPTAKSTSAVLKDDYIYVVGGYDNTESMAVFERYSITSGKWESLASLPKGVSAHSSVIAGNKLYTFGNYHYLDEVFSYDFATGQWQAEDIGFRPSRHNASTMIDNTIYVFGGTVLPENGQLDLVQKFQIN